MIYLPLAREIDQIVTFFSANQISPFFFIMRYTEMFTLLQVQLQRE